MLARRYAADADACQRVIHGVDITPCRRCDAFSPRAIRAMMPIRYAAHLMLCRC